LSIERLVAPAVDHDKVAVCPLTILDGVTVKVEIVGKEVTGGTPPKPPLAPPPPPPPPQATRTDSRGGSSATNRHRIVDILKLSGDFFLLGDIE
jgi:hypothetical protein